MEYLICTNRSWVLDAFLQVRRSLPGRWSICVTPEDLASTAQRLKPRFIFFPHWSFIVPEEILCEYESVCFHMTDVPYGRGGSPLQNLIERGHTSTQLTALRMTSEIDAGPIYMKRPLSLDGSAEEIFCRASELSVQMIAEIVATEPEPVPQKGESTIFFRRKPSQSELPINSSPEVLYDHIRMLDAPGYPHAFLRYGSWWAIFTDAQLIGDTVQARVRFEKLVAEDLS
ncbi:hypothetical protein [Marinobacter sp. UBA2678]|jgi:methionyl-tRNA formyltransferase|uniref:hypothetical protein n=1 Tax=Marinobacter sp. UBA2678 TaxID=1946815 RepID=UPI00257F80CB|nr:hypothetical protein [Marinobacter sp. UBA2678]|tara:strand:+ start:15854 stop:16540 length:687 start_codon:yes stop_codon:yes gene_type:complete